MPATVPAKDDPDPLIRGLVAMQDFGRAMNELRTSQGVSPGELEITAGNILDLARTEEDGCG